MIQLPDATTTRRDNIDLCIRNIFPETMRCVEVKQFTLCLIASIYGVYFDAMGLKPHFFEKKNLRELKDLFRILADGIMNKDAVGSNMAVFDDWSYMRLTSYLNNQFAHEQLNPEEMRLFDRWSKLPISRRSVDILNYVRKLLQDNDIIMRDNSPSPLVRDNMLIILPDDKHGYQYSYGELLYGLYRSTRTTHGMTKEMIYCLLATYSVTLNRRCQRYITASRDSAFDPLQCEDYTVIKEVLGSSIAGSRANDIFSTVFEQSKSFSDPITGKSQERKAFRRAGSVHFKNLGEFFEDISLKIPYNPSGNNADFAQNLCCIEMLCMFFTDVHGGIPERKGFQFEITTGDVLSVKAKTQALALEACFNIFNFAINSFSWREYFDSLHKDLCDALMQLHYPGLEEDKKAEVRKKINDDIEECSLKEKYEVYYERKTGMRDGQVCPLPIQHFDMMYNIIKREADNRVSHGLPDSAPWEQYGALCWKVYTNVRDALQKQDEYYGSVPNRTLFVDMFDHCPFIEEMNNMYGTKKEPPRTGKKLDGYMTNLGRIVATVSESSGSIDETIRIFNR